ncbi:flagella basal body P-ring formation protein FlgA [Propioniciclava sp. MC1595]|nr:flagella basal body P-ring formation protein FlgA [Propioniciclava sp. MC1595]
MIASVAALLLSALGGVWLWTAATSSVEVVVARAAVPRGAVIDAGDLMVARVSLDPAVASIPASEVSTVVGQRAALDISAGGLLTPDAIASETVPAKGETVVGLSLVDGMLPAIPLKTGDDVRVVQTPGAQGQVGDVSPVTIAAKVVAVTRSQDGQFALVDLLVSADAAPDLAARAATGKVAVVLDSRER